MLNYQIQTVNGVNYVVQMVLFKFNFVALNLKCSCPQIYTVIDVNLGQICAVVAKTAP